MKNARGLSRSRDFVDAPTSRRRRSRVFALAGALGVLGIAAAMWVFGAFGGLNSLGVPAAGSADGFNVLLITFDTTRADHLGFMGAQNAATPNLDSLAARGACFESVVVSAPLTLPSHATMLTGLFPHHHGIRTNASYALDASSVTLAERLRERGYATAAFVSSFVLDRRFGLDQGFDEYDYRTSARGNDGPNSIHNQREANAVTDAAAAWLDGHLKNAPSRPFFQWVHYYDPHFPYISPMRDEARFQGRPYDAEIAYADAQMGRLLKLLDERGIRDRTLVVFTTDHGESLDEHGEDYHGLFIYDATIRGALVLSCPALWPEPARTSDRLVCTADIYPTVLSLVGVSATTCDGMDLATNDVPPDRAIPIESRYALEAKGWAPLYGLRRLHDKFILAPNPEYYDLASDPSELRNLYAQYPTALKPLDAEMSALLPELAASASARRSISDTERRKLESLGYLTATSASQPSESQRDPKDCIALLNVNRAAQKLVKAGDVQGGLRMVLDLMDRSPADPEPVHTAAQIYEGIGKAEDALEVLTGFAARHPDANVFIHIARVLASLKRWDDFDSALHAAEALDPRRGTIPLMRGDRLMEAGRYRDAVAQYERAFDLDGERMGATEQSKLAKARQLARAGGS